MKMIILLVGILLSAGAYSQTIYNFDKASKDSIMTTKTAIWQGRSHPVWATERGTEFIAAYTKAGKYYRKYIPKKK